MIFRSLFKKQILIFFTFFLFLFFLPFCVYADDLEEQEEMVDVSTEIQNTTVETSSKEGSKALTLNSRSCIVLDRVSKKVIYGKNEFNKVKMASTTKIMTATVVIENASLDTTVTVSKKAANTGGSRLGLKTGDKVTIRDLLHGLMHRSGNDAAVALAESVGGSIDGFSTLMNQKAQDLNLSHSHFESPHGLDSDEHYTTAYELSILTDYALKNPTFSQIVGTKTYTITINGYPRTLSNTNELLGNLNGVYGVKTGFTNGANRCLVTAVKRNNMDVICIVLGADTKRFRTQDSIKLIENTFQNFEYLDIQKLALSSLEEWKKKESNSFYINKGTSQTVEIGIEKIESNLIPVSKEDISQVKTSMSIDTYHEAPIHQGDPMGSILIQAGDKTIATIHLVSNTNIKAKNITNYFLDLVKAFPSSLESVIP